MNLVPIGGQFRRKHFQYLMPIEMLNLKLFWISFIRSSMRVLASYKVHNFDSA